MKFYLDLQRTERWNLPTKFQYTIDQLGDNLVLYEKLNIILLKISVYSLKIGALNINIWSI